MTSRPILQQPALAFRFHVHGIPATQGNHRAFIVRSKATGIQRAVVTEGKRAGPLNDWRHAINDEARRARGAAAMIEGPIALELAFYLPRPASAPKTRRTWPIGARSGDLDKYVRAAGDAMTGVLFADDSQIVSLHASKDYGDPGVTVYVRSLQGGDA